MARQRADHEDRTDDSAGPPDSGGGDRTARERPSAPMASRSRQHLQIDFGTARGRINSAAACRAGRRSRQALVRVAGGAQACCPHCPDRADRHEHRSDRHPPPSASAHHPADVAQTPIQGVNDDETEILSVPVRLRRAGREIRMVIDGTDPFAATKPDARLIRLLLEGAPVQGDTRRQRRPPLCLPRPAGRRQPVLFHSARRGVQRVGPGEELRMAAAPCNGRATDRSRGEVGDPVEPRRPASRGTPRF